MARCVFSVAVLVLAIAAFSASATAGQTSSNGSIRGYVRDSTGAVVPGTTVTATAPESSISLTAVADDEGYYRLLEVPPGEYTLTVDRQAFSKFVRPGLVARAGLNLNVDIDLAVG